MSEKKILIISPDSNAQGGIASVIKMYKEHKAFDDATYLASFNGGNALSKLIHFIMFLIKYIFTLLTQHDIRIVHVHSASGMSFRRKSLTLKIARVFKKKTIFHLHGGRFLEFYKSSSSLSQKYIQNTLNKCDVILTLSKQWKKNMEEISSNKNIKILYNPIVIGKEYHHTKQAPVNIIFMGKLVQTKGIFDIIEAAKHIESDVIIDIYGDGDTEKIQKYIDDNKVSNKVFLKGWISGENKNKALKQADIYILPSYIEGLPISILEAMSYSLPVIATPVGGVPETVKNNETGFLIPTNSPKELAQKIDTLSKDYELRLAMGKNAYEMVKEKFDIKIILDELSEVYNEIL